jgi:hypothetical protein
MRSDLLAIQSRAADTTISCELNGKGAARLEIAADDVQRIAQPAS